MNAASKALAQTNWHQGKLFSWHISKSNFLTLILLMAVVFSALSVIYVKTLNRHLFSELAIEQQIRDKLQVRYGQLLLEQSSWATPARVSQIAKNNLQMITPATDTIVVIKQD